MVLRPQARRGAQPPKAALSAERRATLGRTKNQVFGVVEHSSNPFTVYMVCISHGRGRMVAARGRLPCCRVLGLCTRYRVFVGEAYMPPGRGERSRGVCGEIDRSRRTCRTLKIFKNNNVRRA